MSKRRDPESVIVQYFTEAAPEAAGILFRVVRGILDARGLTGSKRAVEMTDLRPTPSHRRRRNAMSTVLSDSPSEVRDR